MFQALGRFSIGFVVGTAFTLALFFVTRSLFLTTIQTPESEPHYEVLYTGFNGEVALAVICLLPVVLGLISTSLVKRKIHNWITAASTILAGLFCLGIMGAFYTIMGDALWFGMD